LGEEYKSFSSSLCNHLIHYWLNIFKSISHSPYSLKLQHFCHDSAARIYLCIKKQHK
jgi:hypothetical protein